MPVDAGKKGDSKHPHQLKLIHAQSMAVGFTCPHRQYRQLEAEEPRLQEIF